jgi:hypothetical protein
MNANELMYYLRGLLENTIKVTPAQIQAIRTEVLSANPVEVQLIPVEMANTRPMHSPCNCHKEKSA